MLSGVATSQTAPSTVLNNQINLGDVFAEQTLNVETVTDGFSASTIAPANSALISVQNTDAAMTSNQENAGAVLAHGVVNVGANGGNNSNFTTTAVGNAGTAAADNGTLTGRATQLNTGPVTARSQLEAHEAELHDLSMSTLAQGNSQGLTLINGAMGVRVSQGNTANVLADGGAIAGAITGTASVAGTATGNNITLSGTEQSAARVITEQSNAGITQASKFTAYGSSYLTSTAASASGNNLSATNEGPLLDVTSSQYNTAYVRAQAEATSYQFSAAQVGAHGVGNSALVGNYGAEVVLDNIQTNGGGGVEVVASFEGNDGYDAVVSSTAMGNAVTSYACSQCSGQMSIKNNQVNSAEVGARTTTTAGSARSVSGVTTATGNNASFYVSSPGH
ncbi:holdfast anchor protein HfaD [Caulobacter sp. ErkDOM-YI]|uniref:holdfast anchor protein HfaD n=1 Tax=unclassified Caulobacter TaxID=2648921 RepID=UPI003AF794A0